MQFYLDGYRPGDPLIDAAAPLRRGAAGRPARGGRRPDRRLRAGRPGPGRAARRVPRDQDGGRRPPGRPARGRPGRRRRLPHRGDVRGVRAGRPAGRRGLLGQRGRLLAARPRGPRRASRAPGASRTSRTACRSSRTSSSTRRGCWPTCATPWRGRPSRLEPFYGLQAADVQVDADGAATHPVTVTLRTCRTARRPARPRRSARSTSSAATARAAPCATAIGRELVGDPMNQSWGVMDVLAVTDFPDIRLKSAIHSANQGNILIIPREGGYLVRLYIELDQVSDREMLDSRSVTPEKLAAVANRVLHPYTLDVKDVGWWSVYEIGQRLCDKFDDVPGRGDRHAAPAGLHRRRRLPHAQRQGRPGHERVDGRRLEPRLEARRRAARHRPARAAAHLLGGAPGDRPGAHRLRPRVRSRCSAPRRRTRPTTATASTRRSSSAYFAAQGRFTAGVATRYAPSMITGDGATHQHLAEGFPVGMRFHSAPVVRLADAKPVQLGHAARADGAWRLYVFADRGRPGGPGVTGPGAVRVPGVGEVPARPVHPGRRRPRRGDRRPRRLPAGPPRPRRRTSCRRCCCRGRAASG